jgi:ATP-dependent Clp protease ATP-binding subunit ClpC
MTGVPLHRLEKEEAERLLSSRRSCTRRSSARTRRSRRSPRRSAGPRGLKDPKRPMGSFIFVGPVRRRQDAARQGPGGVHVRRRGRADPPRHVRVHGEAQRLAPRRRASRLRRLRGGRAAHRAIRRRPYAVVLLDEVEKAHPDVFNMLLQIMEEGRLTDSFGRHVDFRNTILIMTSNIGADLIKGGGGFGFQQAGRGPEPREHEGDPDEGDRAVLPPRVHQPPRRRDRLPPAHQARPVHIIEYETEEGRQRLEGEGHQIELDKAAKDFLIDKGYNPDFGARPLRRAIRAPTSRTRSRHHR